MVDISQLLRESFASQERVSGFPERKGLTSGEVRELPGKSGELPGKSGKLPGNPWTAVEFHSVRTSGEVAEELPGKVGELPGKFPGLSRSSGEPDSLPVSRQICLQSSLTMPAPKRTSFTKAPQPIYYRTSSCLSWHQIAHCKAH